MSTPESKVKTSIKRYLKEVKAYYYMPVPCGIGVTGVPDIIACVPTTITQDMVGKSLGIFAGIECKAPGKIKNTTPNQKQNLEDIMHADGVAIVADDVEAVRQAVELLRQYGVTLYNVP